jgi:hypothetical protein
LICLLGGKSKKQVVALTAEGASIRTTTGNMITFYRNGRPAFEPIGATSIPEDVRQIMSQFQQHSEARTPSLARGHFAFTRMNGKAPILKL